MFKYWRTPDGKAAYFTRGCAENAEEANRLIHELKPYFDKFILINSCCLKEKQEQSLLECLKALVNRADTDTKVFITGCSATIHPELYSKWGTVVPNNRKFDLTAYGVPEGKVAGRILFPKQEVAMISIQEGCNSACTYCIIPKARGKSVSFSFDTICKHIQNALDQGQTIIRFVGTNLTQYVRREDDGKIYRLSDLIDRVLNTFPQITLLQTEFIEPESSEVERLCELMDKQPRLDRRLDLGIQSFCNEILHRMNRRTTKERLHMLYTKYGDKVNLLADIIVGFPGETEEQFQEDCEFIKTHNVYDAHVHCFSARPGTPAYDMPNQIDEDTKYRRANELRMLVFQNYSRVVANHTEANAHGAKDKYEQVDEKRKNVVQFELTKECGNNCTFCYNYPDTIKHVEDKVQALLDAHAFLNSDEMMEYDGVAFIGGELFDGQFNTYIEKLLFSELFPVALYNMRFKRSELRVASGMMMEDISFMIHCLRGELMSGVTDFSCVRVCTSYDTIGRFTTPHKLELWEKNMWELHRQLPKVHLHTEIILTEDFMQKVLNGEFSIPEFKKKYNTDVDFIEPNSGFFYKDKYEFQKHIPNFFPYRDTFMQFMIRGKETGEINLNDLLDVTQKANRLFMVVNGRMMDFRNRHNVKEELPCNIPSKSGYIDSDENMRQDVLNFMDSYGDF